MTGRKRWWHLDLDRLLCSALSPMHTIFLSENAKSFNGGITISKKNQRRNPGTSFFKRRHVLTDVILRRWSLVITIILDISDTSHFDNWGKNELQRWLKGEIVLIRTKTQRKWIVLRHASSSAYEQIQTVSSFRTHDNDTGHTRAHTQNWWQICACSCRRIFTLWMTIAKRPTYQFECSRNVKPIEPNKFVYIIIIHLHKHVQIGRRLRISCAYVCSVPLLRYWTIYCLSVLQNKQPTTITQKHSFFHRLSNLLSFMALIWEHSAEIEYSMQMHSTPPRVWSSNVQRWSDLYVFWASRCTYQYTLCTVPHS